MSEINDLARILGRRPAGTGLRRGVVTAVDTGTHTATVDFGGSTMIPGVPYYLSRTLNVGDVVDVLFAGPAARAIGSLGTTTVDPGVIVRVTQIAAEVTVTGVSAAPTELARVTQIAAEVVVSA